MADLISIMVKCTNFAAIKHKNQRRKDADKTPYINHPIGELNWPFFDEIQDMQIWLCL